MNKTATSDMVRDAANQVLEDMAFIFTEPAKSPEPWDDEVIEAELEFFGPQSGRLFVSATPEFCIILTANLLGVEPAEPEANNNMFDALGELTNIIGGVLMEKAFGNKMVHLGVPKVRRVIPPPQKRWGARVSRCVPLGRRRSQDRHHRGVRPITLMFQSRETGKE